MIAQTPGTWLKSGGFHRSADQCRKALAACGLDPDEFGSYKEVGKSQTAARQELREAAKKERGRETRKFQSRHVPPCALSPDATNIQNCQCQESQEARDLPKVTKPGCTPTRNPGIFLRTLFIGPSVEEMTPA